MVNEKEKNMYKISKEEIIRELKDSEYKNDYYIYETKLKQDEDGWKRGKHHEFEMSLVEDNINYFAYIKFYLDNGQKYGLVAGKTGSYNVNGSGNDVRFRIQPDTDAAKKWLKDNDKEWCQTEILLIKTKNEDKDASEKEALKIEKYLVDTFGLLES